MASRSLVVTRFHRDYIHHQVGQLIGAPWVVNKNVNVRDLGNVRDENVRYVRLCGNDDYGK